MNRLTQWVALAVVACLAVLAAGWVLLISPQRSEAAELDAQADGLHSSADALRTQLQVLKAQAADLPAQEARIAAVAVKIPPQPELPELVRAVDAAATGAGVRVTVLTPETPAPVVDATAGAATTPAAGTAGAATTPAAGTAPTATASATAPATAAGTLHVVPVSITVVGGYRQVERFVAALEDLSRALRVTAFTVTPLTGAQTAADGRSLTAVLTTELYTTSPTTTAPTTTAPPAPGAAGAGGPGTPAAATGIPVPATGVPAGSTAPAQ